MGEVIEKFHKGDSYSEDHVVRIEDIRKFAEVSGDFNPIHIDKEVAEKSIFGRNIAHGMLIGSYISAAIGMKFPGEGTIYLSQDLIFKHPVYIDDKITVIITILEMKEKDRAVLETLVVNHNDDVVVDGKALVKLPL